MMQEQKKILKDIKEQKQEFEREKQRMAKDEVFKKSEKNVKINLNEDALLESRSNVRESGRGVLENNDINIKKSNKEVLEEKDWNIADKTRLNEKRSQDENNDINIAVENNRKKSDSTEIFHDKNIEEMQKAAGNAADKSLPVKETDVDREIPERLSLQKKKQDEAKMGRVEFNDSESMKGPILNVLSKGVLQKSFVEQEFVKENDNRQAKEEKREVLRNEFANASEKLQGKYDDRYRVPIALKMMNQSRLEKMIVSSLNKSEPEILAIHRDILQNNEREKRDIHAEVNGTASNSDRLTEKSEILIRDVNEADRETCSKLQEDAEKSKMEKEFEKRPTKSSTTAAPLINTNDYLSEQRITRMFSVEPHVVLNANVKQRDLKVFNPKDNTEI